MDMYFQIPVLRENNSVAHSMFKNVDSVFQEYFVPIYINRDLATSIKSR